MTSHFGGSARRRWSAFLAVAAALACGTSEPDPPRVPAHLEIVLDRDTLDAIQDTLVLHALLFEDQGSSSPADGVTWSTSVGSVAQLVGASVLESRANGSTLIRAQRGALSDTATVVVRQVAVALKATWSTETVFVGDTITVVFGAVDRHDFPMAAPSPPVVSSPSLQLVSEGSGRFRALTPGQATIQAVSGALHGSAALLVEGPFVAVAASSARTCALLQRGAVYCWGFNFGARPALQEALPPLVSLTADDTVTCGLTAAGVAWCWTIGPFLHISGQVQTAERFRDLSASYDHICGMTLDGRAVCWGWNQDGQVGSGPTGPGAVVAAPATVPGVAAAQVTAGAFRSCALTGDGTAWCWGLEFGDVPIQVGGAARFSTMDLDYGFVCGLSTAGAIICLTGTATPITPVPLRSMNQGDAYTCALADGGVPYCWGENVVGQLGDGTFIDRPNPVVVAQPLRFTSLSAGGGFVFIGKHTCGVSDGSVYCWGNNVFGELGVQSGGVPCFEGHLCYPSPVRVGRPRNHP